MGVIHMFMLCQRVVLWLNGIYMELILAFMYMYMYFNYRFKVYLMLTILHYREVLYGLSSYQTSVQCTVNKVVYTMFALYAFSSEEFMQYIGMWY